MPSSGGHILDQVINLADGGFQGAGTPSMEVKGKWAAHCPSEGKRMLSSEDTTIYRVHTSSHSIGRLVTVCKFSVCEYMRVIGGGSTHRVQ